jgi:putative DNA primase/helicase
VTGDTISLEEARRRERQHVCENPTCAAEVQTAVERLAALPLLQYEQFRIAKAKELGFRASTLDWAVENARAAMRGADDGAVEFPEIEPWPEPVDGGELLADLERTFAR